MSDRWKKILHLPPSHNGERPDPEAAQRELERLRAETRRVKAETEKYATLGTDLRRIYKTNHLAEAFIAAAQKGGGHA